MCFRKKDKMNSNKSNQLAPAPVPKSPKKDAENAQPNQGTPLNETGGKSQGIQSKNALDETQETDKQDSLASLKPSIKTAKRGQEIAKSGVVSGKRKKEYKTVNLEDMSNFDKTMTIAQETSCASKTSVVAAHDDAKKSIQ